MGNVTYNDKKAKSLEHSVYVKVSFLSQAQE